MAKVTPWMGDRFSTSLEPPSTNQNLVVPNAQHSLIQEPLSLTHTAYPILTANENSAQLLQQTPARRPMRGCASQIQSYAMQRQ